MSLFCAIVTARPTGREEIAIDKGQHRQGLSSGNHNGVPMGVQWDDSVSPHPDFRV